MRLRAILRSLFVRSSRPPAAREQQEEIARRQQVVAARMRALGLEVDVMRSSRGQGNGGD